MSTPDRKAMLDRGHLALSIRGQCRLLGIARAGVYRPAPANDDGDLALLRRIDALFMAWPFLGSRRMTAMLRADGLTVNRKRLQRLMRRMRIAAWISFYNGWRPHQAVAGRTPMAVWREGITGAPADTAVDMTPRHAGRGLDDAAASPTCPPRQQQQTTCVA